MADNENLKENVPEQEGKSIAMEILSELKRQNETLRSVIKNLLVMIAVLIILLAGTNIYHIHKWSQFDTVVVDSGEGGNAGYIGNDGDVINYGESGGTQKEATEGK